MMSRNLLVLLALCLQSSNALTQNQGSRRAFLETSSLAFLATTLPAFADDVGDLAMPEQDAKSEEEAMAERLRRKAALKGKASTAMTFTENFAAEQQKKEDLKKSKTERRNAMCEELGRGC